MANAFKWMACNVNVIVDFFSFWATSGRASSHVWGVWGQGLSSHFATFVLTFNSGVGGDFQGREYAQWKVVKWQLYTLSKTFFNYDLPVEAAGPGGAAARDAPLSFHPRPHNPCSRQRGAGGHPCLPPGPGLRGRLRAPLPGLQNPSLFGYLHRGLFCSELKAGSRRAVREEREVRGCSWGADLSESRAAAASVGPRPAPVDTAAPGPRAPAARPPPLPPAASASSSPRTVPFAWRSF